MRDKLLLQNDELIAFNDLGVDVSITGVTFARELSEPEMRRVGWVVVGLKNRSDTPKDQAGDFPLVDWMLKSDEWFGEGIGLRWAAELDVLRQYKDHLLRLIGATLIQLQGLEYLMNACCSFWNLRIKDKRKLSTSDLLHPDLNHRTHTMGVLHRALADTGEFQASFCSRLEQSRLGNVVDGRNRFIHHFWVDISKAHADGPVPSIETLQSIEEFVSGVLKDSGEIERIFRGMFYLIGRELAEKSNKTERFAGGDFSGWSNYEREFLSILKDPE